MRCPRCGAGAADGNDRCPVCLAPLGAAQPATRTAAMPAGLPAGVGPRAPLGGPAPTVPPAAAPRHAAASGPVVAGRHRRRADRSALGPLNTGATLLFLMALVGGAFAYQHNAAGVLSPAEREVAMAAEQFWAAFQAHDWGRVYSLLPDAQKSPDDYARFAEHMSTRAAAASVRQYHVFGAHVVGTRATAFVHVRIADDRSLLFDRPGHAESEEATVPMKFRREGGAWKPVLAPDGYGVTPFRGDDE